MSASFSLRALRTGADSIQSIDTTTAINGTIAFCTENNSLYQLDVNDASSTADGTLIIAPTTGPGRWKRVLTNDVMPQSGYDQNVAQGDQAPGGAPNFVVKDNTGPVYLQVLFPTWVDGDILEVDWSISAQVINVPLTFYQMSIAVSRDSGSTWFWIDDGGSADEPAVGTVGASVSMRGFGAVTLAGNDPVQVRLVYVGDGQLRIFDAADTDKKWNGMLIRCRRVPASSVVQAPPNALGGPF